MGDKTKQHLDFDERFTDMADRVSTAVGRYPATIVAVIALICWIATGPAFHWSDTWQLIANTPTTWIELFLGFFACAATNRAERHLRAVLGKLERMEREQGQMVREIHAHIRCEGHTHIGEAGSAKRHAVRGPDGRWAKVADGSDADEREVA